MAWRLNKSVQRGEIDDTIAGRVTGRIWLLGRSDPVALRLTGNCHSDLASCRMTFDNSDPKPEEHTGLAPDQKGVVGDMTLSRKCRIPLVPIAEMLRLSKAGKLFPSKWGNTVYLEWFSKRNGRVVIESHNYQVRVSDPDWQMSTDEKRRQFEENQKSMADWFGQLGQAVEASVDEAADTNSPAADDLADNPPMDEFEWEQYLRESDECADRFADRVGNL